MAEIERPGRAPAARTEVVVGERREVERVPVRRVVEPTNADLLREAIDEARELIKVEVALAKDEVKHELKTAGVLAGAGVVAAASALAAVCLLLVALGLVISISALPVFVIGLILLGIAAVAAVIAYEEVPKKPMKRTTRRVLTDARMVREHV
jgi:hypothetical protein